MRPIAIAGVRPEERFASTWKSAAQYKERFPRIKTERMRAKL
jgi:hypothetical protein